MTQSKLDTEIKRLQDGVSESKVRSTNYFCNVQLQKRIQRIKYFSQRIRSHKLARNNPLADMDQTKRMRIEVLNGQLQQIHIQREKLKSQIKQLQRQFKHICYIYKGCWVSLKQYNIRCGPLPHYQRYRKPSSEQRTKFYCFNRPRTIGRRT